MIEGLRHLLFPEVCVVCRKLLRDGEEYICPECFGEFNPFPLSDAGGEALKRVVATHFGHQAVPEEAWCLYPYHSGGNLHDAMHALKYGGIFPLGTLFGRLLGSVIAASGRPVGFDGIVPVPLHSLKNVERTYNQAEKIAEGVSGVLGTPLLPGVVERCRYTSSQTGLTSKARSRNMAGAFRPGRRRCPDRVLLVDDVLTTGATLVSAAGALRDAGASSVAFAVVALTGKD
jgi:predicted amidophosphoribosyltransferase